MKPSKLIFLAFILSIISLSYKSQYKGIIGNLCEKTADNPMGYCYEQLPQRGFPMGYFRDNGSVSVVGKLHLPDDHFELTRFTINTLIYFSILYFLFFIYKKTIYRARNKTK